MRYFIQIRVGESNRLYPVEASSQEEAIERLKLRLPPDQRNSIQIDSIAIDPRSLGSDSPFGEFGGE